MKISSNVIVFLTCILSLTMGNRHKFLALESQLRSKNNRYSMISRIYCKAVDIWASRWCFCKVILELYSLA